VRYLLSTLVAVALLGACSGARYFPELALDPDPKTDAELDDLYGEQLQALRETPMCCGRDSSAHAIRFTWLRTFHHPVVLRMDRNVGGHWVLRTKIGGGDGGYSANRLLIDHSRPLLESETSQMLALVGSDSGFWDISTHEQEFLKGERIIPVRADGSHWIVEVRHEKRYHVVDRWSPKQGRIYEIGKLLMTLSREQFEGADQ
jgi:hypothetical protein